MIDQHMIKINIVVRIYRGFQKMMVPIQKLDVSNQ